MTLNELLGQHVSVERKYSDQHWVGNLILNGDQYEIVRNDERSDLTGTFHADRVKYIDDVSITGCRQKWPVIHLEYPEILNLADLVGKEVELVFQLNESESWHVEGELQEQNGELVVVYLDNNLADLKTVVCLDNKKIETVVQRRLPTIVLK